MLSKRILLAAIALAGAVSASCADGSSKAAVSTVAPGTRPFVVTCDQVIGRPAAPFASGYRRVLGVVAAPPAFVPQVVSTPGEPWPYWEKAGMAIHAGDAAVDVSVPPAWRSRAAITWGNGKPAVSALRFAPCPSPPAVWNAYAGGFFLRERGACVPLLFQVGQRRALVRFGIDRRCV
jgi:hypothetical protein